MTSMEKVTCPKCGKRVYRVGRRKDDLFDVRKKKPSSLKEIAEFGKRLRDQDGENPPLDDIIDADYFLILRRHKCR